MREDRTLQDRETIWVAWEVVGDISSGSVFGEMALFGVSNWIMLRKLRLRVLKVVAFHAFSRFRAGPRNDIKLNIPPSKHLFWRWLWILQYQGILFWGTPISGNCHMPRQWQTQLHGACNRYLWLQECRSVSWHKSRWCGQDMAHSVDGMFPFLYQTSCSENAYCRV